MLRFSSKTGSMLLFFILCIVALAQAKILQLTSKNLPNVLKAQPITILYHHPDCQYSSSYKQHYHHAHAYNQAAVEHVGIVDCSQQQNLCKKHNISEYPALRKIHQNMTIEVLNADLEMGDIEQEYRGKEEYASAKFVDLLKKEPNFMVVLFEEIGMPVLSSDKPKNSKYYERIFYLSEGRLAQTLAGFVNNKPGCWIFYLSDKQNGQLLKHHCGDTYQSPSNLINAIETFLSKLSTDQPLQDESLLDSSNHQNETILGYKQLLYWLKHYDIQLEISTHSRISMCIYIYTWSSKCQHCDYEVDMKIIKRMVEKGYSRRRDEDVYVKNKVHSYDIDKNKFLSSEGELRKIAGLGNEHFKKDEFHIVPNLIAICFSTFNNRDLQETISLQVYHLDKIIASQNLQKFVDSVIDSQYKHAKQTVSDKKEPSKEEL